MLPTWQTYWFYQYRYKLGMIRYCNHTIIAPNRGEILFVKNAKSYNAKYQYQIPSATHPSPFRCMIVAIGLTWQHEALINPLMPCWDAPRAGCSRALPLIAGLLFQHCMDLNLVWFSLDTTFSLNNEFFQLKHQCLYFTNYLQLSNISKYICYKVNF